MSHYGDNLLGSSTGGGRRERISHSHGLPLGCSSIQGKTPDGGSFLYCWLEDIISEDVFHNSLAS